jgi:hypothetical protein
MVKKKINITLSNRWLYSLITLGILAAILVTTYALTPGVKPNPGHLLTEIVPPAGCTGGKVIAWDGGNLVCTDSLSSLKVTSLTVASLTIDLFHVGKGAASDKFNSIGNASRIDTSLSKMNDSGDLYIEHDLEVDGTISVTGGYTTIGTGDVAENLLTVNSKNSLLCNSDSICLAESYNHNELDAGDVVCVNMEHGQTIMRCDKSRSMVAVGVVTNTSVIQMGNSEAYGYPVAVAGVVWTKASNENGAIKPGDVLVSSSRQGYAMKADSPAEGMILGVAYDFCSEKDCRIPVFVSLSYSDPSSASLVAVIKQMKQSLCELGQSEYC